jgi:PKD repeat protein
MKKTSTLQKLFLGFLLIFLISFAVSAQTVNKFCQDGKVYFKYKDNVSVSLTSKNGLVDWTKSDMLKPLAAKYQITGLQWPFGRTNDPKLRKTYMLEFSDYADVDKVISDLQNNPDIEYAEPVPLFYISYIPDDPLYAFTGSGIFTVNANWHLDAISAEQAWDITKGSSHVKVAVVDNAMWTEHPDLVNKVVKKIDLADNDTITTPFSSTDLTYSHGTHTCGLVAAESDNTTGVASIGYNSSLIAVKAGRDSDGALIAGFQGITWATDNGANIISMSWGSVTGGITGQNVVDYAYNHGVVLLASAGNDGTTVLNYPAAYDHVISVASTDEGDAKSSFSQYGPTIDVCAPGGSASSGLGLFSVLSTTYTDASFLGAGLFGVTGKYDVMAGTSMSCPITAGLCALMLAVDSTLTPDRLEQYLKASCDNIDAQNSAYIGQIGAGRINAWKAVKMAQDSIKPLVANFSAGATLLSVNGSTNFYDHSIGNPVTWSWSFPGAIPTTSTQQNPTGITFPAVGGYTVSLTVTDTAGHTSTETKTNIVLVQESANSAWIVQASGFAAQYRGIMDICIVDPTTVWASAFDGSGSGATLQEFTKTVDGGNSWIADTITGVTGYGIGNITALSSQQAWVTLYNSSTSGGGKIMVTGDGGSTWTQQPTATFTGTSAFPNIVYFFDQNNGCCIGDPNGGYFEIYTTTDGGNNWIRVAEADIPAYLSGEMGWTGVYDAVGDTIWFGTNKGRIYKSVDKGLHWTAVAAGTADCNNISMADNQNGLMEYIAIDQATGAITAFKLRRTTDGGDTWNDVTPSSGTLFESDISAVPGRPGFYVSIGGNAAAGMHGSSYSLDYGDSWTTLDTVQYTAVKFISPTTGWAGGFNLNSTQEGMYKWANPPIGIKENSTDASTSVYPVPAQESVTIEFYSNTKDKVNIKIYNPTGQMVYENTGRKTTPVYRANIDVSALSAGIYMAVIETGEQVFTKKIVIR